MHSWNLVVSDFCEGMGYKKDYDGVWLIHQDNFDDLLSQLKQTNDDLKTTVQDDGLKSLEEHSKNSRARVHYKKFTKSKDLTNATKNDLDCILGRHKRLSKQEKLVIQQNDNESSQSSVKEIEDVVNKEEKSSFKTITNKLSINDYFASKMALLKKRKTDECTDDGDPIAESTDLLIDTQINTDDVECCPKKKKKKKNETINDVNENNEVVEKSVIDESVEADISTKSVKKKKKKKKAHSEDELQIETEVVFISDEDAKQPTNCIDVEEYDQVMNETKKNKNKKHKDGNGDDDVIEMPQTDTEPKNLTRFDLANPFKGSNLFELNGYTPYLVTHRINELLDEKDKISRKKSKKFANTIAYNPDAYNFQKKPMINFNKA
jgi:Pin2-interacting protein X1